MQQVDFHQDVWSINALLVVKVAVVPHHPSVTVMERQKMQHCVHLK